MANALVQFRADDAARVQAIQICEQCPMRYYAVIDTNVLVSAMLKWASVPGGVLSLALDGPVTFPGTIGTESND